VGSAVAAVLLIAPAGSTAATITVTATSDDVVNNGTCTLREAIDEANANSDAAAVDCNTWSGGFGNDTIQLNATTYVLDEPGAGDNLNGTGDLDADTDAGSGNLTIAGSGAGATVIDPAVAWNDRIVDQISPGGGTLTVSDLTVTQGNVAGDGGGIRSDAGTLQVERARVSANTAQGLGGGIFADGVALSIVDSDVSSNTTADDGGGVLTLATTTTIDSTLVFNNLAIGSGGTQGGGIYAQNTTLNLVDSIVNENSADEAVGAAEAGGIVVLNGGGTIRGTEISENKLFGPGANTGAGARLQPSDPLNFVNSTISGNEALDPLENGAGLVLSGGTVNLVHSTIGPNPVRAGGVSALLQTGATVNVRGSAIETFGAEAACGGAINSQGHNVFTDGSCGALGTGDEANADPMLGLLQDNGGPNAGAPPTAPLEPVRSHLPANASTAVDHVPQANCTDLPAGALLVDQRGFARPMDFNGNGVAECDAGSIELQTTPATPVVPVTPVTPAPPAKQKKCKKKKKKRAGAAKRCKKKKKKK